MNKRAELKILWLALALIVSACSDNTLPEPNVNPRILTTKKKFVTSTTLGNFVTTAVQEVHKLDFVFLPTDYFPDDFAVRVEPNMAPEDIERVVNAFEPGPRDLLQVGSMKGRDIRRFVIARSRERYNVDMESAGLWYYVGFDGGLVANTIFSIEGRTLLDDDKYYRIAISDDFFFGSAFPGYKFRNGLNFTFKRARYPLSLRDSLRTFLQTTPSYPLLTRERAKVERVPPKDGGYRRIHEIQGARHASPLLNHKVTTRGVITAIGTPDWYPWGFEFYIESAAEDRDNDDRTSEGLHIHSYDMNTFGLDLKIGDYVALTGIVFEDIRVNGMGDTTLRYIEDIRIIEKDAESRLPPPQSLSKQGRSIPMQRISTYGGRLMEKQFLNLEDGIDFWESMEGMRVFLKDPVVLGFNGGRQRYYEENRRRYLNLEVTPLEFRPEERTSQRGGLLVDFKQENFNPQIVSFITNYLSYEKNLNPEKYYTVGDVFIGDIEGVLTYNRNLFGGGEYAIVLPKPQDALINSPVPKASMVPLKERPLAKFKNLSENEITFATYNLENLAAFQINKFDDDRLDIMASSMIINLKCPDVLNLVEIQDNNGIDFRDGQDAQVTMRRLRSFIQSSCLNKDYDIIDVPPFLHGEGGQPGGNIRTAIIYNRNKLIFETRDDGEVGHPAVVQKGGVLANNPGRIYPFNAAFRNSRRSPVIEFEVRSHPGEKIYLIGNHLNSKLGDMDFWGNVQIARANSDNKRGRKTALINRFIHWLEIENPKANIVVLGDFNALAEENSMSVLTDKEKTLKNMIFTLPKNERYTTGHGGNSQPLDYIFVNNEIFFKRSPEVQVLHINSDYMGRLSDHDPVVLYLKF